MYKYGFIVKNDEPFETTYETADFQMKVIAVPHWKEAYLAADALTTEGYQNIDVDGDFTAKQFLSIENSAIFGIEDPDNHQPPTPRGVACHHVKYYETALTLKGNIPGDKKCIVVLDRTFHEVAYTDMPIGKIAFVGSTDGAVEAILKLKEEGYELFMLNYGFGDHDVRWIMADVDHQVVVGSAGIVNEDVNFVIKRMDPSEWPALLEQGKADFWDQWEEEGPVAYGWFGNIYDNSIFVEGEALLCFRGETHLLTAPICCQFAYGEEYSWIVPKHVKKRMNHDPSVLMVREK